MNHTLTKADVDVIYADLVARGWTPKEVWQGTRTEVHALLLGQLPAPTEYDPAEVPVEETPGNMSGHARNPKSKAEVLVPTERMHELSKFQISHLAALWQETDRLVLDAGITEGGRS